MKVAINGFGRIGRLVARAILEQKREGIELVAINDLGDAKHNALLFKRDSVHGRYPDQVGHDAKHLLVGGRKIALFAEQDPAKANPLHHAKMARNYLREVTGL